MNLIPRNPKRISILLEEIEVYWKKNSDMRLMQILINHIGLSKISKEREFIVSSLSLIEDDYLIEKLTESNYVK